MIGCCPADLPLLICDAMEEQVPAAAARYRRGWLLAAGCECVGKDSSPHLLVLLLLLLLLVHSV